MAGKKGRSGAKLGNQNAVKLHDSDTKQRAYQSYCDWIALGRSKEGWKFQSDELSLTWKTMEKYIAADHIEFPPIKKEMAEADSFNTWEQRGMQMLTGVIKAETALYQMFMRNKFGWDKEDIGEIVECAADKILDRINGREKK